MGKVLGGVAKIAGPVIGLATGNPMLGSTIGAVGGALAGGSGGSTSGGSATTTSGLPAWLEPYFQENIKRAYDESNKKFVPYTGQAIAPLSSDETDAFSRLRASLGMTDNIFQGAQGTMADVLTRALQGPSTEQLNQLMNPFTQSVVDIGKRRAIEDFDLQRNNMMSQATKAGAFGGDRRFILESMLNKNLNQNLQDLQSKGLFDAYNQAMNQFNQGTATAGTAAMNQAALGTQQAGQTMREIDALAGAGATQRDIKQSENQFNYEQFLREQGFTWDQIAKMQGVIGGSGDFFKTNTATQTLPKPNKLANILGGALAGSQVGGQIFGGGNSSQPSPLGFWGNMNNAGNGVAAYSALDTDNGGGFLSGISDYFRFKEGGLVNIEENDIYSLNIREDDRSPEEHKKHEEKERIEKKSELDKMKYEENDILSKNIKKYAQGGPVKTSKLQELLDSVRNNTRSAVDYLGDAITPEGSYFPSDLMSAITSKEIVKRTRDLKGRDLVDPVVAEHAAATKARQEEIGMNEYQRDDLKSGSKNPPPIDILQQVLNSAEGPVGSLDTSSIPEYNDIEILAPETQEKRMPTSLYDLVMDRMMPKQKEPTLFDKINTPLFQMGVAMMGSSNPSFGGALKEGMEAYQGSEAGKQKAEDSATDRLLKVLEIQNRKQDEELDREYTREKIDALRRGPSGGSKVISPNALLSAEMKTLDNQIRILQEDLKEKAFVGEDNPEVAKIRSEISNLLQRQEQVLNAAKQSAGISATQTSIPSVTQGPKQDAEGFYIPSSPQEADALIKQGLPVKLPSGKIIKPK